MRLEDYTASAICRAMRLPDFIEESWTKAGSPTLRVVLMPSFHPELCITLSQPAEVSLLSVVALKERFWGQRSSVCLPCEQEEVRLPLGVFEQASALFIAAHSQFDPDLPHVCADGMNSESCLVSRDGARQMSAHVSEYRLAGDLAARLIEVAWQHCRQPFVRNALAEAGRYLNLDYPMQELPPESQVTRLAILGDSEERRQFLEMLREAKKGAK